MAEQWSWYLTEPWEPVSIRRGDALGFRAASDYFADLLAPGLSNSTFDARWISLLSWSLKWSQSAWQSAGNSDLSSREGQRERYAWLRPLELLWVARTLASKKADQSSEITGQLRGRRSIERWREDHRPDFSMTREQQARYRQIGTYGGYRVVLRNMPGLTKGGDGWTLDDTGLKLARLVNESLPPAARLSDERFERHTRWKHWSAGKHSEYWTKHGWADWNKSASRGLLPTANGDLRKKLTNTDERFLLAEALFDEESNRSLTAYVLAHANGKTHSDLCDALAGSSALEKKLSESHPAGSIKPLPAFSRLADAAMDAMRVLWDKIKDDGEEPTPPIEKLARSPDLKESLDRLRKESDIWLNLEGRNSFRFDNIVKHLAEAMHKAKTPVEQIRALSMHHQKHGGGRNWFREDAGIFVGLVASNDVVSSNYRFRLNSLSLLAAQCGVARMNDALVAMAKEVNDEEKDYAIAAEADDAQEAAA